MARPQSNAVETAFNYIKDLINHYELKPGDVVSDSVISQKLSMSRTPVREAVQRLVGAGLIEREKSKFIVTHIPFSVISDIFEVRESIEIGAVRKIIQRGGLTSEQIGELHQIHASFETNLQDVNYESNFKPDSLFHSKVVEFSENRIAIEMMKNLELRSERIRWLSILTPDRYTVAFKEHDLLLNALVEGNLHLAERRFRTHISNSLENYRKVTEIPDWENIIVSIRSTILSLTQQLQNENEPAAYPTTQRAAFRR